MKVCHFVSYSADTHYLVNLGKGLAKNGVDLVCGTLFETGKTTPEWINETENINYFCLNAKSKINFPKAILSLAKILRREKIDILQTHLYEASFVGLLAAKLARIPVKILTRHYLDQAHQIGNNLAIKLDRWEANDADQVVVLSNAVKEFMTLNEGIKAEKIRVIHQGFDFERFTATEEERQNIRQEFGFQTTDFVIGTIANFFPIFN
jgi:glycosyltransferase involved in cell wall biosynthesis